MTIRDKLSAAKRLLDEEDGTELLNDDWKTESEDSSYPSGWWIVLGMAMAVGAGVVLVVAMLK